MPLSDIVNVVITKDYRSVSRAGFGTLLIVGPNLNINGRLEFFSDVDSALEKVIGTSTLEESLITKAFSPEPSVERIALCALQASKTLVFSGTYTAGSISAIVNGRTITQAFSTDLDGTLTAIASSIAADVDVDTAAYTAGTNTLVVTPLTGKAVGIEFVLTGITGTMTYAITATELSETYATALSAALDVSTDFYGVTAATRTIAKQQVVADWAETHKVICGLGSADDNIVDQADGTDTTSIAYYIKSMSYERSFVIYTKTAATEGVEAAYLSALLPNDPGTYTAMFKTLAGITVDSLTDTKQVNAHAKYCNTYESIGGVNITREGKVGSGEYIDIVIFIDWLTARITESVFATMAAQKKIPMTDAGILSIKSALQQPLKIGQDRGGISPTAFDDTNVQIGGYKIIVPRLQDISTADKTARLLDNVKFTAWLAGAIHKTKITGTVTL